LFFIDNNVYLLFYFISLPITGLFARFMIDFIKETINNWRLIKLKSFSKSSYMSLKTSYTWIYNILEQRLD
jgi:hypothetical protein